MSVLPPKVYDSHRVVFAAATLGFGCYYYY